MECKKEIMRIRLENTAQKLRDNNMDAYVVNSCDDAVQVVNGLIKSGETIASGGSMSLKECGIMELINNGNYNYIDRNKAQNREEIEEVYRKAFFADTYLCSANAVTENGELYNVDGNSNRVAAICYGPKSVVMIVGANKIVKNLDEAMNRVRRLAAPANVLRLNLKTPCGKTGECISYKNGGDMCNGCHAEGRVCCNYVVSAYQRHKSRMKVILVNEELGY